MARLRIALLIYMYDLRKYYLKAPVISWGIMAPLTIIVLLYFSAGVFGYSRIIPSMFVISMLFAATSMAQVAISFEKMSGSINMMYYLPITTTEIMLGKMLGGITYGFIGSLVAGLAVYMMMGQAVIIRPVFLITGIIIGSFIFVFMSMLLALVYEPIKSVALLNIIRFTMIFLGGLIIPKAMMPRELVPIVYVFPSVYTAEMIRYGLYNVWDYVDPYSSLIISIIYLLTLLFVTNRIVAKTFYP